jgi:predicted transcriptional regulator
MDRTTVYLPHKLRAELREIARRYGLAQSEVMREALAVYLAQQELPLPLTIGMGESDSVRGMEYEELLKRRWKRDW